MDPAEALSTIGPDAALVVDLSGVEICDAAGLRMLLAAQAFCGRSGHLLSFRSPSRPVLRLFELTDTVATFVIADGRSTTPCTRRLPGRSRPLA